ncbi:DUF4377 domain-containing protein [[Pseudomonas] boreopolis]|uniref:DUF4377 domain-containing protein n=1 Tax=Xanthomonas boreopolis TaxID=86183 RepID=UPI003D9BD621
MKTLMLVPALAALLAACSNPSSDTATPPGELPGTGTPPATAPAASTDLAATLAAHHWHLEKAEDGQGSPLKALFVDGQPPLQLDFGDGRVSVSHLCNRRGGSYTLEGGTLQVGRMASTMMACPEPGRMEQEKAAGQALEGSFAIAVDGGGAEPRLTLKRQDGTLLVLAGTPTAETRYGGPGEQVFLEVAAQTRPCSHPLIPDKQCLQVRELRYDANGLRQGEPGEWQNFYDDIEGYQHQDGVRNVLRVRRYTRQDVPADASKYAYVLDMVVESETVKPAP